MNTLLVFFALPLGIIILSVVFERVWGCYKLVTAAVFAIGLIVTFSLFDSSYLVYALSYTFLAFISSYLSMLINNILVENNSNNNLENNQEENNVKNEELENNNILEPDINNERIRCFGSCRRRM